MVCSKSLDVVTRGQRRESKLGKKTGNLPAYHRLVQAVARPPVKSSPSDGLFCWSGRWSCSAAAKVERVVVATEVIVANAEGAAAGATRGT